MTSEPDADETAAMALRTPLYLIIAAIGAVILVSVFLPWATVDTGESDISASGIQTSFSGTDAGGWGLAALVAGLVIVAVGILGYFWNPFSDPEALVIGRFALASVIASLIKMGQADDFVQADLYSYFDASAGIGLWLILIGAIIAFVGSAWIVISRPRAEVRLG